MERVRIPHQTGRPVHGKLDSKNSYVARGITVALSKIFLRRPHGKQQVIHAQNYRSTAAALRARPH